MAHRFKDRQLNLDILAEEAGEVAKVVSKIRRFGIDDFHPANGKANRAMLAEEIGHFMFMVATLHAGGVITEGAVEAGMNDKAEKLPAWYRGWMEHECCGGCAEPEVAATLRPCTSRGCADYEACCEGGPKACDECSYSPATLTCTSEHYDCDHKISGSKYCELSECPLIARAVVSKRGQNWVKFSERVRDWAETPAVGGPNSETCLRRARAATGVSDFRTAALEICDAAGKPWQEFSDAVLNHIETYTVPQYGDVGYDRASRYTVAECLEHLSRYIDRYGRNSRDGQQELDFLKMAHYISLASEASAEDRPCVGVGCVHLTTEGCGMDNDCQFDPRVVWQEPSEPELPASPICYNIDCPNIAGDGKVCGVNPCYHRIEMAPERPVGTPPEPRPVCTTDCNSNSGNLCMADHPCDGHTFAPLPVGMTPPGSEL